MANQYELVYVLNPEMGEEELAATQEKIQGLVESAGTVEAVDVWGRRKLAYEIQDLKEGHYVVTTFTAPAEAPRELERLLKITEGVLRYLVVRKEA